jgi:MFS transporter, DHA3 family, macrolide efflux protein
LENDLSQAKKLFNKNYILLFQGQTVSRIGSQLYFMAMALFVKELTGSGTIMGLLVMLTSIPAIIFAPIGGTFADRFSRKKIIIFSDLLNGILMLSFAAIVFYLPGNKAIILLSLLVFTIISNILASFFTPAISAALPDIIPENKLRAANSLGQVSVQTSTILGMALSGVLYVLIGVPLLVFINGITFIFSSISELFIKIPQKIPEQVKGWRKQFNSFKNDTFEGMKYVWQQPGLKKLVFASVFMTFFSTPVIFLLMFYVEIVLLKPEYWFGYLLAANAFGSMVGFFIAGTLKISAVKRSQLIILFMVLNSLIYLSIGFVNTAIIAFFMMLTSGLISGFIQVYIMTILQLSTKSEIRGRVFGFLGTISGILGPFGVGLGGLFYDLTNNITLIYTVCGSFFVLISLIVYFSKDVRSYLAYDHEKEKEVQFDNV